MSTQVKKPQPAPNEWTVADATELYRIASWGDPFFFANPAGHMAVRALDDAGTTMDVVAIVNELHRRGVQFPVLIRFQDVLRAQVRRINEAFRSAIAEANYGNIYRGIYPIKVNQLHEVVDELLDAGRPYGMGLECGSKAELIASLAADRRRDAARLQWREGPHDAVADDRGPEARSEHRARHREVLRVRGSQGPRVLHRLHVAARRARAARDARLGPLVGVLGHELQVRLERRGAHAHGQRARSGRAAKQARAAALPYRQPDRGYSGAQAGDERGRTNLRRARAARYRFEVPRRRWRARRELRQGTSRGGRGHQLQPRGVRERRGVHDQGGVRRERGADADSRDRERPSADRAPLRADRAGARRAFERRSERDTYGGGGRGGAGSRVERDPHGASEDAQAGRVARGVPRREGAARGGAHVVHARLSCRSSSARSRRASSGACAAAC